MKNLFKASLLMPLLLLAGCDAAEDAYKDLLVRGDANVIFIAGQSNASGNSPWSYLETKEPEVYNKFIAGTNNVLVSYNNVLNNRHNKYFEPCKFGMGDADSLFGPEIGIADVFSKENTTTYIIKYAIGGSRLNGEWLDQNGKKHDYYNGAMNWFNQKMKYLKRNHVKTHLIGMFWMQGESDSFDPHNLSFARNHANLVNYFREDLEHYCDNGFNFVDAFISNKTIWWDYTTVNTTKENVSNSNAHNFLIKTNGEDATALDLNVKSASGEGEDGAHYSSIDEVKLGRRAGEILKANI